MIASTVLVMIAIAGAVAILRMEMKDMSDALNRLTAEVAEQKTVIDSAVTLLGSLAQQIRDNVGDEDALNSLADSLDTQTNQLAAAVSANTPAQPAPSEPAPEEPTGGEAGETPDNPDSQPAA